VFDESDKEKLERELAAANAIVLHLHDRLAEWGEMNFGQRIPTAVSEITSIVTRSDGDFVICSNGKTIDYHSAQVMRIRYLKAEKNGTMVVLATDLQGNPTLIYI
jgi:uncharacterized protein (DUF849 family)